MAGGTPQVLDNNTFDNNLGVQAERKIPSDFWTLPRRNSPCIPLAVLLVFALQELLEGLVVLVGQVVLVVRVVQAVLYRSASSTTCKW